MKRKINPKYYIPGQPNWDPLLIIRKWNIAATNFLVKLPLEFGSITCTGIIGTCNCFGSICESRGLSNLKPARSRLFKLMGRMRLWGGVAASTKQIWWLTYANKSGKRSNATVEKLEVIKKWSWNYLRSYITQTVFTSRTPPKRDHHGYTRGWCILIKSSVKFSTTGH